MVEVTHEEHWEESNPGGSSGTRGGSAADEFSRFELFRGDHVSRLEFAFQGTSAESVLDYGSGAGMAAFLLPPSVKRYVGVELDPGPLAWARQHVPGAGGRACFLTPEEFRTEQGGTRFDLILLLEVVEHVRDARGLLETVLHHLAPGGELVVSTPNGALSRHDPRFYQSPFHVTEFDPIEFVELVKALGRRAEFFEQHRLDRADVAPSLVGRLVASRQKPPVKRPPIAEFEEAQLALPGLGGYPPARPPLDGPTLPEPPQH